MLVLTNNVPLAAMNSFGIAARASRLADFGDADDLSRFFGELRGVSEPWYVIGGGNNILLSGDYPGTLLHPTGRVIERLGAVGDGRIAVRASAGVEWDDLVEWTVNEGLGGLENLSFIPGYVGAAPVQNIGAYGVEAKDAIRAIEAYLPEKDEVVVLGGEECRFGYRDSIFKRELKGRAVILSVTFGLLAEPVFRLDYGALGAKVEELGGATLRNVRQAVIAIRREKLPDPKVLGNAGSFFKNPVVERAVADRLRKLWPDMPVYAAAGGRMKLAAGWMIDRAGWKGRREGNVGMHGRQALVLVNYGGATGSEIVALARRVRDDVFRLFGVEIEPEVNIL